MKLNWDYEENLLRISGSLFRYYGINRGHGSDPQLDHYLEKRKPRCVIALLIDAMGISILKQHLPADSFFRKHLLKQVSTVYPPTTTAATTSFLSGHSPAENGWLGWNQYFKEQDDNIILFLNRSQYRLKKYPPDWSTEALPAEKIYDMLNERGIPADSVWPGWAPHHPCRTFTELLDTAGRLSQSSRFIYAYWDQFDDFLHEHGTDGPEVREQLEKLDNAVQAFAGTLPEDTVLLCIADHSQINVEHYDLSADEELCACFAHDPALEQRTAAFYIKPGMETAFEALFRKRFPDQFLLLSHAETVQSGIFGPGIPSERFEEFIGDYTAFALTPLQLDYRRGYDMKGNHAGMVEAERYIPVIVYPCF